jgi:hypothetical protein
MRMSCHHYFESELQDEAKRETRLAISSALQEHPAGNMGRCYLCVNKDISAH